MASISFDKALEIALEQHQAGHLARAEVLYLEILRQDPGNIDAMHLLGVLAFQGGQPEMAVQLISAALRKREDAPAFHYNLAEALMACGRAEDAVNSYRRALELQPDYFEARNNLANALNGLREYERAAVEAQAAIDIQPLSAAPYNNLGNALWGMAKYDDAIAAYQSAVERKPDFAEAFKNYGMCLCAAGRLEEGVEKFKEAIRLKPTLPNVHSDLGLALIHMERPKDALRYFQNAVDLDPNTPGFRNNLANCLKSLGQLNEAIKQWEIAVEKDPTFIKGRENLAGALHEAGRYEQSLKLVDGLLAEDPEQAGIIFLRGMVLRDLNRHDESIEMYRRAIAKVPDNTNITTSLGYALLERGEVEEALPLLRASIRQLADPQSHSNVLLTINYHPAYTQQELLETHQAFAEVHEKPQMAKWKPHANNRDPNRKLRIGYVSPDFRGHSVSYFLEPILENHDHSRFEIYGYAHLTTPDIATWRLRAQIDHWREIASMSADKVAELIRADEIDILVELAGHTANNAMPVFMRKPAPVQINMIGFPSTTGLSSMDYRVTDARCDPVGLTDPFNTEKLLRMPRTFWCYRPPVNMPPVGPLPAEQNGFVQFTSVNNLTKITPDVQNMWAALLAVVPNSRLIMQTTAMGSRQTQDLITRRFEAAGVTADRLDFRPATDFMAYMQLLERSDMTLDPYPFNGGTTTCHSLWMGAPVVTLAGDRHASRMGLSMLTAIGLPEFVAHTPEEYVRIAASFANDLPRLAEVRRGMRERLLASPLLDHVGYTRELEAKYREVWQTWCVSGV